MPTPFNTLIANPKKLFLVDGFGGLFSALLLGVVLVYFKGSFGMSPSVLYPLSITACIFAAYSFTCYLLIKENPRTYLKVVAYANLLYCCVTLVLSLYFYNGLTSLGLLYFIAEIGVIITLAVVELKAAYNTK